jgi:streptomycin 6-kinase
VEGRPWSTPSSHLALVRIRPDDTPAVLKVPLVEEEQLGSRVLSWWSGDGAARVLRLDERGVVLMERARPGTPLLQLARSATPPGWEADERATRTLVAVARRLQRQRPADPPVGLMSLRRWFRELFSWADEVGGFFSRAAAVADDLLEHPQGCRVLHGDLHHENVLWFGEERGWLAIDPKGLLGDPGFDYANLLTNPGREVVLRPGRLERQIDLISGDSGIDRARLLRWTIAWSGLSAAWYRTPDLEGYAADVVQVGLLAERALRGGR